MSEWAYIAGSPWAICDRCGLKRRHRSLAKEWTGLMVCRDTCLDPKPPDMTPPNVWPEGLPIRDPRPQPTDIFVETEFLLTEAGFSMIDETGIELTTET